MSQLVAKNGLSKVLKIFLVLAFVFQILGGPPVLGVTEEIMDESAILYRVSRSSSRRSKTCDRFLAVKPDGSYVFKCGRFRRKKTRRTCFECRRSRGVFATFFRKVTPTITLRLPTRRVQPRS